MIGWARASLFVPVGLKDKASEAANDLDWDTGGALTFTVPLSQIGGAQIVKYGACMLLHEEAVPAIIATVEGPDFPGATAYEMMFDDACAAEGLEITMAPEKRRRVPHVQRQPTKVLSRAG